MVRRLMVPKESGVARRYPKGFEDEVAAEAAADRQVRAEERPKGYDMGAPRWRTFALQWHLLAAVVLAVPLAVIRSNHHHKRIMSQNHATYPISKPLWPLYKRCNCTTHSLALGTQKRPIGSSSAG
jgi:hypothetical protein